MEQLSFLQRLKPKRRKAVRPAPVPKPRKITYRIANIPIRKPKPYQPDPWDKLGQDFEDVNLAEERARILNQGKTP
jgi:hypothetical protein